jgi:release factor glutamine methyltransferase
LTAGPDADVGSLLRWGAELLKKNHIENYRVSAESLLGHILGTARFALLLDPNRQLNNEQAEKYKDLVIRRSEHVPLQYLIGYVEFYNVKIKCDPRALIPRPETEILVDAVINHLEKRKAPRILDIGAGSGNITIALTKNIPGSQVLGVDISEAALDLAAENALANRVGDRVEFLAGDILDHSFVATLGEFDCVVANPPYVAEYEKSKLQPEVVEFEPPEALFSYGDPLRFFKAIVASAPEILKPGGLLAFEIGMGQIEDIRRIMAGKFIDIESRMDLSGIDRVIIGYLSD